MISLLRIPIGNNIINVSSGNGYWITRMRLFNNREREREKEIFQ